MSTPTPQTGKIYAQITKIMNEIDAIGKNRNNSAQGYKFRGIDDCYNELHPLLAKHGVFTVPEVLSEVYSTLETRNGGVMHCVRMKIKYTFYADDGSSFQAIVASEGMDTGDKASNKALAVGHKYALMQVFAIPTEDDKDPENDSPVTISRPVTKGAVVKPKDDAPKILKPTRDDLNKLLLGLYNPYMAKFQGVSMQAMLHDAFGVTETRLLSVEQLEKLVQLMTDQLEDAEL